MLSLIMEHSILNLLNVKRTDGTNCTDPALEQQKLITAFKVTLIKRYKYSIKFSVSVSRFKTDSSLEKIS